MDKIDRRRLFRLAGSAAGFYILGCGKGSQKPETETAPAPEPSDAPVTDTAPVGEHISSLAGKVAVARDDSPYENTLKAIALLGGMKAFLPQNAHVVVKPNIAWNRTPASCCTTNPDVVRAIVAECVKAGARLVEVYDRPCEDRRRTYARSGIADAAKEAGGEVRFLEDYEFVDTEIPDGKVLKKWPVLESVFKADAFINVPIAKDHDTATLTMAMKNLMGVMGGNRGEIHTNMGQKLADFSTLVVPTLNIIDANQILVAGGPASHPEVGPVMGQTIGDGRSVGLTQPPSENAPCRRGRGRGRNACGRRRR